MVHVPSYSQFTPASALASRTKQKHRREGGRAERMLRQAVWGLGLRYRKHGSSLPGRPDLVFFGPRVAVFVDGDFWHGCNWPTLMARLERRANPNYWILKIARNIERDTQQTASLIEAGWRVIRLWETDIIADTASAASAVRSRTIAAGKEDDEPQPEAACPGY